MELIALFFCRKFLRIYPLLLLFSFDIFCFFLPTRGVPIPSHSLFCSLYETLVAPATNSLPRVFQCPLHSLHVTILRKQSTISGSCYFNNQMGISTVMVNNKSASFPICIIHNNFINWGATTRFVLCGILILASNNKSNSVSISAGEGYHNKLYALLYYSK